MKKKDLTSESFWVKANEETFESLEFFQDLEKTFSTGRARNVEFDSGPRLKLPKIKELKVLDAKSAQNICEWELTNTFCILGGLLKCAVYTYVAVQSCHCFYEYATCKCTCLCVHVVYPFVLKVCNLCD